MSEETPCKGCHTAFNQEIAFDIALDRKDAKYLTKCLCDNSGCPRHSNCRACKQFHAMTDHPPTCEYKWIWED